MYYNPDGKTFIAIAGNIGAGKSTLTRWLADKLGYEAHFEAVANNPYLDDFYQDMKRWSFQLQVFFLSKRFEGHREIVKGTRSVIQDRTIYEDAAIFARNAYEVGLMEERDYLTYRSMFDAMAPYFQPPDLLIYLKASVPTLMRRIAKRARGCEAEIPREYVAQLNRLYDEWVESYQESPKLVLPADDINFVDSYHDFGYILDMMDAMRIQLACPVRSVTQLALAV